MGLKLSGRLVATVMRGFVLMVGLAGCQSSDTEATLGGREATTKPAGEKVLQSELLAYCPTVMLREGTSFFNTYETVEASETSKLVYQASITDVSRDCKRADGMLTMNVAVAGKIVPGPLGKAGNITMPIRIAVARGDEVLYSKLHNHAVAVGSSSGAVQFLFTDPNVTFPIPQERNIRVYAGYDEGPPQD